MASGPTWNPARGAWYVQYWKDGKWHRKTVAYAARPKWRPGDPEPKKVPPEAHAALAYWSGVEKDARENRDVGLPVSLRDFLEEHVARYRAPGSKGLARQAVDRFMAWCKDKNITQFDQVTRKACQAFVDHLATAGDPPMSAATIRTRRGYLSAAWGRLLKREEIARNPWRKIEIGGEDRAKPRKAWTPEQFDRLLAVSPDWLKDVLIFGVHTGLRIESLRRIEWSDWIKPGPGDRHFGQLDVRKEIAKRDGYKVPVSRRLHDLLSGRLGRHDPKFIMTGSHGKQIGSRHTTARAIRKACKAADLEEPIAPNHHLRRTFGRWAIFGDLTGRPIPLYVVSRWLGHKNPRTTLIYLDIEEQQSALFMVPDDSPTPPVDGGSSTLPPATS